MNKTMEYMAYACRPWPSTSSRPGSPAVRPASSCPPVTSRRSRDAVERLLDDPELRVRLGLAARTRVVEDLDWSPQSRAYVGVFDALVGLEPGATWGPPPPGAPAAAPGREPVEQDLESFVRWRGRRRESVEPAEAE